MRPADRGNLTLNVRREQGRIKVVVDALDKNNEFLNFLQIQGNVVNPDLKSAPVELVQTAPGRYEATIENAEASGNYFVNLGYRGPDKVQGVISTGVSVPYSDEYRELRSNPTTLETLATLTDGQVVDLEVPARRPGRPAAHRRRGRPLPPRPEPDQSPLVRRALADPALAGGLPVPGRRRRPPDRARRRLDQASRRSTSGRSSAARRPRRPANTWTSSGAARPRSTSSSTAPRAAPRAETSPLLVPGRASGRSDRRAAAGRRSSRETAPGAAQKTAEPQPRRRVARDRETELHQPPAQGQAARLGRTGEGQGTGQERTPSHEQAAPASRFWPSLDRTTFESRNQLQRKDPRRWPPLPTESMEARAEEFRSAYEQVKGEIAKVIVGHDEIVHGVLTCLFIGGHALLEGVPGPGQDAAGADPGRRRRRSTSTASSSRPT